MWPNRSYLQVSLRRVFIFCVISREAVVSLLSACFISSILHPSAASVTKLFCWPAVKVQPQSAKFFCANLNWYSHTSTKRHKTHYDHQIFVWVNTVNSKSALSSPKGLTRSKKALLLSWFCPVKVIEMEFVMHGYHEKVSQSWIVT